MICDRFLDTLRQPLKVGKSTRITGSVGAAVSSDPNASPAELVQQADLAMYSAKRAGRDRFKIYSARNARAQRDDSVPRSMCSASRR